MNPSPTAPPVTPAVLARVYGSDPAKIPAACARCGEHHDLDAIACDDPALLQSTAYARICERSRRARAAAAARR